MQKSVIKKTSSGLFLTLLYILAGIFIGYSLPKKEIQQTETTEAIHQEGYNFINPLLECETKTLGNNQKYIPFEKDLTSKINNRIQEGSGITASVYFRNLRNGPWFGINEDMSFSPASLMKLPLFIMYLKWNELDPSILDKKLTVNEGNELKQSYQAGQALLSGSTYSIDELIRHLIVFSDNAASNTLIKSISVTFQKKVFSDLGIPQPENMDYVVSVKEYASFFRVLYNASYLSRESSEKALGLLSEVVFDKGITGKIPKNIKVAHKFGERELLDTDNTIINQLHDCGIVYYEKYPYLLCVMTRGKVPMETLSNEIQDISKTIFDEISSRYK